MPLSSFDDQSSFFPGDFPDDHAPLREIPLWRLTVFSHGALLRCFRYLASGQLARQWAPRPWWLRRSPARRAARSRRSLLHARAGAASDSPNCGPLGGLGCRTPAPGRRARWQRPPARGRAWNLALPFGLASLPVLRVRLAGFVQAAPPALNGASNCSWSAASVSAEWAPAHGRFPVALVGDSVARVGVRGLRLLTWLGEDGSSEVGPAPHEPVPERQPARATSAAGRRLDEVGDPVEPPAVAVAPFSFRCDQLSPSRQRPSGERLSGLPRSCEIQ